MGHLWWSTELNPGLSATELQLQSTTATTSQPSHSRHCLLMQRQSINWPAHTRKHLHRHVGMHKSSWVVLAECLIQRANNSIYSTKQDFKIFFCLLGISEQLHFIHFVKSYKSHQPQGLRKQQATRVTWLHLKWSDCWECPELEKGFHSTCLLLLLSLMHIFQDSHWRTYFNMRPAASCIRLSICKTGPILLKKKKRLLGHGKTQ